MNLRIDIILLFLAILGINQICFGQTDSLLLLLEKTKNPEKRADLLYEFDDHYTYRNLDLTLYFAQEAIVFSRNAKYPRGEIVALIHRAVISGSLSGKFESGLK